MKNTILWLTALVGLAAAGCGNPPAPTPGGQSPTAAVTASPTASARPKTGDAAKGKGVYEGTCMACHGADGKGVTNLGKPLVGSAMLGLSDEDLVAFVIKGRDASDTANTTGIAMPPRGGNPALSDQEIFDAVVYLRTLK